MTLPQEQLRHQYLSALGISSWLPRAPLPGAAPSADWVAEFRYPAAAGGAEALDWGDDAVAVDEGDTTAAAADVAPVAAPAGMSQPAVVPRAAARPSRAALAQVEALDDNPRRPSVAPAPVQAAAATAETAAAVRQNAGPAPRFKLAFVLAGGWLVIDSLPPQSPQGFGNSHQRLLGGVLRALGVSEAQTEASLLSWPMLASQTLDQGADEAARAVQRKLTLTLQAQAEVRPLHGALLLGEAAARWVLEREEELDALRGIRFTLRAGLPCVCSGSLSQALQLPEFKAQLWRDLQVLIKR